MKKSKMIWSVAVILFFNFSAHAASPKILTLPERVINAAIKVAKDRAPLSQLAGENALRVKQILEPGKLIFPEDAKFLQRYFREAANLERSQSSNGGGVSELAEALEKASIVLNDIINSGTAMRISSSTLAVITAVAAGSAKAGAIHSISPQISNVGFTSSTDPEITLVDRKTNPPTSNLQNQTLPIKQNGAQ